MSQVVRFEKIVPEGKAMGHLEDGRAVFAIGVLPGELARVDIHKSKQRYAEAVLLELMDPSPQRGATAEAHSLSCSPWQAVDYAYQCELKTEMLAEAMRQHHVDTTGMDFIPTSQPLGYRNRLDFTLAELNGHLQLAFHQRGSREELIALPDGCKLGSDVMNRAALALVEQLSGFSDDLTPTTITIRQTNTTHQLLTILTTPASAKWSDIDASQLGHFIVTRPQLGSTTPGAIVYQRGTSFITERIAELDIAYPYNAFFQANTPMFEQALTHIITAAGTSRSVIELYGGVGAIGLPLAKAGAAVHGIELIASAVEFAQHNARANAIKTYTSEALAAERIDADFLKGIDCVVVDPPRAGLHPWVTWCLQEANPACIIYLSCNPVTQARDLALLQPRYTIESLTGFDFYPGTLHLESLAILSRR